MLQAAMIDSREPEHIQQMKFGAAPVVVTLLEAGDLWASCDDGSLLVIERKTPNDLLGSIGDNRLLLQAQKMRERSTWCYVVITGTLAPTHDGKTLVNGKLTGWAWASVQGALLSVQELGVQIVHCAHDNDYAHTVQVLANRHRGGQVLTPVNTARVMTPAERLLTGAPSIGLERAQAVLEHFHGNAARGLCWLTWLDTVTEVGGIAEGIKRNVRQALGLAADEELTVWSKLATEYYERTKPHDDRNNGAGSQTRVDADSMADDSGSRTSNEGQPAFWSGNGSAGRGDYGQGSRVGLEPIGVF